MTKKLLVANLLLITAFFISSCNWFKEKTKETVNRTGEVVAKAGSEFADGVSKGVQKTFANEIVLTGDLKTQGLKTGKVLIRSSDSATDNILSPYLIFENDFDQPLTVKLFGEDGREYGRTTLRVAGKKGSAGYFDILFDKRTNIDGKGKITFE